MLRWYLIRTKPSSETIAETNLKRQGYDVYLPRILQTVRRGGRWRDRIGALFPGYLFLRLNEGLQPLGPVRSTVGVAGPVRFGPEHAIVPEGVLTDLWRRADPVSGLHRLSPRAGLIRGTAVRITTGPFEGLEGVFEREEGADRVVVLLKLLGQYASSCIPVDSLVVSRAV